MACKTLGAPLHYASMQKKKATKYYPTRGAKSSAHFSSYKH